MRAIVDDERFAALDTTVVRQPRPSGPAAARNAGVDASRGDYIVFIDDDVLPDRHFIATHLEVVSQPHDPSRPIVSFGPFVQPGDWPDPTPWNLWEAKMARKEADAMLRGDYEPSWRQFHTGNNCVPVAKFREIGGFDTTFTRAEDDELALRLFDAGCEFRFAPAAIAWHYSNRSLEAWLRIPRAYAHFDVEIDRLHPHMTYLAMKKAEMGERRLPLRLARRVFAGGGPGSASRRPSPRPGCCTGPGSRTSRPRPSASPMTSPTWTASGRPRRRPPRRPKRAPDADRRSSGADRRHVARRRRRHRRWPRRHHDQLRARSPRHRRAAARGRGSRPRSWRGRRPQR